MVLEHNLECEKYSPITTYYPRYQRIPIFKFEIKSACERDVAIPLSCDANDRSRTERSFKESMKMNATKNERKVVLKLNGSNILFRDRFFCSVI